MDFPRIVNFTPVVDTAIYANGDVLFDSQLFSNAAFDRNRTFILDSVTAVDKSDNPGIIADVWLLDANVAMGAVNGAPSITDAAALSILGSVSFAAADWKDLGGVKVASLKGIGLLLRPVLDTQDIYVASVLGAVTPTFGAASDLAFRFGFRRI